MPYDDKNVLGGTLSPCSTSPRTGFYRDGCCNTGPEDFGLGRVSEGCKVVGFSRDSFYRFKELYDTRG